MDKMTTYRTIEWIPVLGALFVAIETIRYLSGIETKEIPISSIYPWLFVNAMWHVVWISGFILSIAL